MRKTRNIVAVIALSVVAAACSGSSSSTTAPPTASTTATGTPGSTVTTETPATTGAITAPPATTVAPDPITGNIEGVVVYDDLSQDHVEGRVEYDQQPPVGGAHASQWLTCGVYVDEVDVEMAVHSLEHGAVWITYDRGAIGAAEVVGLAELVQSTFADDPDRIAWVLVSPYAPMPGPLVASAWGRQLVLEDSSDPRLVQFLVHFANGPQNPEPGAPC